MAEVNILEIFRRVLPPAVSRHLSWARRSGLLAVMRIRGVTISHQPDIWREPSSGVTRLGISQYVSLLHERCNA